MQDKEKRLIIILFCYKILIKYCSSMSATYCWVAALVVSTTGDLCSWGFIFSVKSRDPKAGIDNNITSWTAIWLMISLMHGPQPQGLAVPRQQNKLEIFRHWPTPSGKLFDLVSLFQENYKSKLTFRKGQYARK